MPGSFSIIDREELRIELARWTMKVSRFAPQPESYGAAAFIDNYAIPDTDFYMSQSTINESDKIVTTFRTEVEIPRWQTREDEKKYFTYCKILESDVDDLGNIFSHISGYIIIDFN